MMSLIVDNSSAVLGLSGKHTQLLNADHNVCKFKDPSESNYCSSRNAFVSVSISIEKTYLYQKEMEALSLYLSLVDRPWTDLAIVVDQQIEGFCT